MPNPCHLVDFPIKTISYKKHGNHKVHRLRNHVNTTDNPPAQRRKPVNGFRSALYPFTPGWIREASPQRRRNPRKPALSFRAWPLAPWSRIRRPLRHILRRTPNVRPPDGFPLPDVTERRPAAQKRHGKRNCPNSGIRRAWAHWLPAPADSPVRPTRRPLYRQAVGRIDRPATTRRIYPAKQ